ncbi:MAG TPA: hypothetical protein VKI19_07005 [Acidimicrobiales bacterium]|nr:hypothetical protein [Acidimicrobiales bacterium]
MLDDPVEHRYIHGGFEGTDTRFSLWYPPVERWEGRMYQPLEGANAGHEDVFASPLGADIGGLEMTLNRLGGYMVESNMGHIGVVMDPKAGLDPTMYGWRAAAESARFSKFLAEQVLGARPHHSYVWGGSGGARRSPLCLAYGPDVWDGALPFMGDALDGEYGDFDRLRTFAQHFCAMFNVQRVLRDKIYDVIDAMLPGGSGDPFAGLTAHQREELATLYRLGYPRGDEYMIAQPMGQIWLWSSYADRLQRDYPDYWEAFWTKPGHVGFDQPQFVNADLIDVRTTVVQPLYAEDLIQDARFQGDEYAQVRSMAGLFASMHNMWDIPMALELENVPDGYRLGTGVRILSGPAAGRRLYALQAVGNVLLCDGEGEASNLRFQDVSPGDEVHVDNHAFLAYCYAYRHHLTAAEVDYDCLRVDGVPIYPQYQIPEMSPFMGTVHTGRFEGKMIWVHHTHDASLWPSQGIGMKRNVERERGDRADDYFCLRWTENAEHVVPRMAASPAGRDNKTWLIDYQPAIEQSLVDLAAWVEDGVRPAPTAFEYRDGRVILPPTAAARGGIQPVVTVEANGASRTEVRAGEAVTLRVRAEVPPGAGRVIGVKWDFDGSGSYPMVEKVDGSSASVDLSATHTWDRPGTYFATALVESHREGDVHAVACRVPNLAAARVIVT